MFSPCQQVCRKIFPPRSPLLAADVARGRRYTRDRRQRCNRIVRHDAATARLADELRHEGEARTIDFERSSPAIAVSSANCSDDDARDDAKRLLRVAQVESAQKKSAADCSAADVCVVLAMSNGAQ
ncbi:MAG TPA: hypothetical protein VFY12_03485 [Arenimonas sp.]|nr:hypothetical protein [Arenimonas sp.]